MKVKKGDNVLIISGKDKGRTAKILRSLPKERMILVEGINLKSKHVRPKKQGEKGQVVKVPASIDVSDVKFICPKCGKAARLGYKIESSQDSMKKFRICKKCNSEV
ncbi:MAG: 50S ribosomal protein L24 [Candidatus Staskawiczbacteria bacterium RIFCSPLOWO2_01_FULL_40_39]|uniref:Large ribosomal subunit protein uL24 n=1 Tax=Candidatus Staskawiczbacteria bacterium RIFCSPHIGHO2_01_FULL_39_25 TaxID=1802202 RepID=A0A1G2HQE0_9BACT|nr:MAG: 50S ribosomal protein L24 [Candidatus Staskawiczbacteria bacterium RIFCSPHIGHO2_01_FULL_39_25]OGZ72661.1 MAG: 50S ribosomal protein L24 [Candidatus Staskawiczbacteria bacterium RIFCSPLOWO2_01_FULL_40_39]OGZ76704.1 MAG: 50S ribosomal protein L24 [Candidatus Staskawiczbacteria bacterium RIFCSPLOWO2_02_FULL_39_8]